MTLRNLTALCALSLGFVGCGNSEEATTGASVQPGSAGPSLSLTLSPVRFGDFDMMAEQRVIRVATTFSRTNYFLDAGTPRGATYEGLMEFGKFVNQRLGTGRLQVHVVVMPIARDELLQAVVDGKADIAQPPTSRSLPRAWNWSTSRTRWRAT